MSGSGSTAAATDSATGEEVSTTSRSSETGSSAGSSGDVDGDASSEVTSDGPSSASSAGESDDSESTDEGSEGEPYLSSMFHTPRPLGSTAAAAGYWEYLPPGYGGETPAPLLVFLHGIGENGEGSEETLNRLTGGSPPRLIENDDWPAARPFVVLSPQFPGPYCPDRDWVASFIDFALATYQVDLDRVYLTGASCGAYGVWNYLGGYTTERVAAAVPIAGNGNGGFSAAGCALGTVPIWAFHGDADEDVLPSGTTAPVASLQACNPEPVDLQMTIYPGVGHDSWSRTYSLSAGHDIYTWMLGHVRAPSED